MKKILKVLFILVVGLLTLVIIFFAVIAFLTVREFPLTSEEVGVIDVISFDFAENIAMTNAKRNIGGLFR